MCVSLDLANLPLGVYPIEKLTHMYSDVPTGGTITAAEFIRVKIKTTQHALMGDGINKIRHTYTFKT